MDAQRASSFREPQKSRYSLKRIPPPHVHALAYATGGMQLLYDRCRKQQNIAQLPDYGEYTNSTGHFCPQNGMPPLALRYQYLETIGRGQSSMFIKAKDLFTKDWVAIKILHTNYYELGAQEIDLIRRINLADPYNAASVLRMKTVFSFDDHFCMVFEYLDPRPLLKYFKNLDNSQLLVQIRRVAVRLITALGFLQQENVIHADLKPENILLGKENDPSTLKVVDFGNAVHCVHDELSLYYEDFELQTLLYRAPEVMFGNPFSTEIDMWSVGCILAELYLGEPLFYGLSKTEVLKKTVELLGPFPCQTFQRGKFFPEFQNLTTSKPQFNATLHIKQRLGESTDYLFASFLSGLLKYNPDERLTPVQAAMHPFLAAEIPCRYLLPREVQGSHQYSSILLTPDDYHHRPEVSDSIKRQHLTSHEILRFGTHVGPAKQEKIKKIAQVEPLKHENILTVKTEECVEDVQDRNQNEGSDLVSNRTLDGDVESSGRNEQGVSTMQALPRLNDVLSDCETQSPKMPMVNYSLSRNPSKNSRSTATRASDSTSQISSQGHTSNLSLHEHQPDNSRNRGERLISSSMLSRHSVRSTEVVPDNSHNRGGRSIASSVLSQRNVTRTERDGDDSVPDTGDVHAQKRQNVVSERDINYVGTSKRMKQSLPSNKKRVLDFVMSSSPSRRNKHDPTDSVEENAQSSYIEQDSVQRGIQSSYVDVMKRVNEELTSEIDRIVEEGDSGNYEECGDGMDDMRRRQVGGNMSYSHSKKSVSNSSEQKHREHLLGTHSKKSVMNSSEQNRRCFPSNKSTLDSRAHECSESMLDCTSNYFMPDSDGNSLSDEPTDEQSSLRRNQMLEYRWRQVQTSDDEEKKVSQAKSLLGEVGSGSNLKSIKNRPIKNKPPVELRNESVTDVRTSGENETKCRRVKQQPRKKMFSKTRVEQTVSESVPVCRNNDYGGEGNTGLILSQTVDSNFQTESCVILKESNISETERRVSPTTSCESDISENQQMSANMQRKRKFFSEPRSRPQPVLGLRQKGADKQSKTNYDNYFWQTDISSTKKKNLLGQKSRVKKEHCSKTVSMPCGNEISKVVRTCGDSSQIESDKKRVHQNAVYRIESRQAENIRGVKSVRPMEDSIVLQTNKNTKRKLDHAVLVSSQVPVNPYDFPENSPFKKRVRRSLGAELESNAFQPAQNPSRKMNYISQSEKEAMDKLKFLKHVIKPSKSLVQVKNRSVTNISGSPLLTANTASVKIKDENITRMFEPDTCMSDDQSITKAVADKSKEAILNRAMEESLESTAKRTPTRRAALKAREIFHTQTPTYLNALLQKNGDEIENQTQSKRHNSKCNKKINLRKSKNKQHPIVYSTKSEDVSDQSDRDELLTISPYVKTSTQKSRKCDRGSEATGKSRNWILPESNVGVTSSDVDESEEEMEDMYELSDPVNIPVDDLQKFQGGDKGSKVDEDDEEEDDEEEDEDDGGYDDEEDDVLLLDF